MLTLSPVTSTNVVDVLVNVSDFVVLATCKTRNAPRKLFICEAVNTLLATNVAGNVVGVAIRA